MKESLYPCPLCQSPLNIKFIGAFKLIKHCINCGYSNHIPERLLENVKQKR